MSNQAETAPEGKGKRNIGILLHSFQGAVLGAAFAGLVIWPLSLTLPPAKEYHDPSILVGAFVGFACAAWYFIKKSRE